MNIMIISSPKSKWAEELFSIMVEKEGYTPSEAIRRLKRSPFFDPSWVVEERDILIPFEKWIDLVDSTL